MKNNTKKTPSLEEIVIFSGYDRSTEHISFLPIANLVSTKIVLEIETSPHQENSFPI